MAYKLPSHLHRNRHGMLYFRLTIPQEYRPYIGVSELYRSLGTANVREAVPLAQSLHNALRCAFSAIDTRAMSEHEKTPPAPTPIDPAALQSTLKHAKERHRLIDKVEEMEQAVTQLHLQRVQQQKQHRRELGIAIHAASAPAAPASPVMPPASPLLSKALEAFIKEKTTLARWTPKTLEKKEQAFRLFGQFMRERLGHDARLNEIDKAACVDFLALLQKLPPNITKTHRGHALGEVATLGLPPMAPATINGITGFLSGFFQWCKENPSFKMDHNPAYRLAIEETPTKKLRAFKDDELAALFSSTAVTSRTFLHPYHYWLIPLALHTGARLGELCQLALSDFIDVQGVPCIDINDEEEKRLKNRNSRRLVPVHSTLIDLGLVRYVEAQRQRGETRLFPEIDLTISASHTASKWFNDKRRYSDSCGVTDPDTNFHSFRRTFITRTVKKTDGGGGADPHDIAAIVGHEHGLITMDVYFDGRDDAVERRATVEKFQLPATVRALIPPVESITFGKQPPRKQHSD
ncbi:site-specific integrase [Burkholderia vietnamiensis]|uniref:site-specific integrase n=1 Tax=Burkholderia vietnamiensis TaxID=60552 RepID=UPI001CF4CA5F|nr:site-specific integrase [Burkholderia vietnamiensis]MCA8268954.1 site-specific integrase [Burkholderia vietnamiensis]